MPGLRVYAVLTAPDDGWVGPRGRLDAAMLSSAVPDVADRHVRVCGPLGMEASARAALRGLGIPDHRVESEAFGGPPTAAPVIADAGPREVRFSRSDVVVVLTGAETLLDAAGAAGVALDKGCLAGICGRCRVKLTKGEVAPGCGAGLSAVDRGLGVVLACQARPRGSMEIER